MPALPFVRPQLDDLNPNTSIPYVDVHGHLEIITTLVAPDQDDAPSSNILLSGPHGTGKSLLAAHVAAAVAKKLGKPVPLLVFDCHADVREYHLRGTVALNPDGSSVFILGPFPAVIDLANEAGMAILVAEEISALAPGAQKQFNSMTDWRDGIFIPQLARNFQKQARTRVAVIGTMNPIGYGGVYMLNADLRSRFDEFYMPYPDEREELAILKQVCPWAEAAHREAAVKLATETRTDTFETHLSTRDLVRLLQNIRKLGKPRIPLQLIYNKFEGTAERDTVKDRIHATFAVRV